MRRLTQKASRGDKARNSESRSDSTAPDSAAVLVEAEGRWPGAWTLVGVALLYVACIAIATYPTIAQLGSRLPSLGDPCEHLWVMRRYKSCLMESRNPFYCPEIQYPVGVPLGYFPPLLLPSLQYLILSKFIINDAVCYNIIFFCAFLGTGLGTFLLCWFAVRDRACAALGGLLAMLSGPMMLHGFGHIDLIELGAFPLFLVAWIRFVDAPRTGRLLAAVGLYLLVVMSAAYFTVLATFPAAAYAVWHWVQSGLGSAWAWLRVRAPWFATFAGLALAGSMVLLASQLWCIRHGIQISRFRREFEMYSAPWWSYIAPSQLHLLGRLLPLDPYRGMILWGSNVVESCSYLGLVTTALLGYAAACQVRFRRASYWWLALGLLLVLSGGVAWKFGPVRVPLPGHWLWDYVFRDLMIRCPARFNLLAAVVAAVLASAGMRHLLARFRSRAARGVACGVLGIIALVDLSIIPFGYGAAMLPRLPACYGFIKGQDPKAAIVDVPQSYDDLVQLNAVCNYWQSLHGCPTTAGYSGVPNVWYNEYVLGPSPFAYKRLANPGYLARPQADPFVPVNFRDYVWLYLTFHRIRYVVVHTEAWYLDLYQRGLLEIGVLDRLRSQLECAKVFEDERAAVYDRERLEPPKRPVILALAGWGPLTDRPPFVGHCISSIGTTGRLAVYNPDPDKELTFTLEAMTGPERWPALLRKGDEVLARWDILTSGLRTYTSPPIRLEGVQELVLERDGEGRPSQDLLVSKISLGKMGAEVLRER